MAKKQKVRLTDLSGLIGFGENPKGFMAQNTNGTSNMRNGLSDGDAFPRGNRTSGK